MKEVPEDGHGVKEVPEDGHGVKVVPETGRQERLNVVLHVRGVTV